jgi:fluoride exporter
MRAIRARRGSRFARLTIVVGRIRAYPPQPMQRAAAARIGAHATRSACMPWTSIAAVGGGAALGAWLRWGLGVWLNPLFDRLPLGTLAANLAGGLLMGLLLGFVETQADVSPELRLFAGTGFLGGLTTFSTFSGEAAVLLERGNAGWAAALIAAHVAGSILATLAGWLLLRALLRG